jgi:hypothetical protein
MHFAGNIFCSQSSSTTVNCTIPLFSGGTSARIQIPVTVPSNSLPQVVLINATATSQTCDNDLSNNENSFNVTLALNADLSIAIDGPGFGTAGQVSGWPPK